MASPDISCPLSGQLLSSVVPAKMTAEGEEKQLSNIDLALKLHYIKAVYYFPKEAVQDLTIFDIKLPIFQTLSRYTAASGRIRRCEENGRPFIKCNDSGVRVVEVSCTKTVEEWLGLKLDKDQLNQEEDNNTHVANMHGCLTYNGIIGPDIEFSPLVYVQFTRFKCGGIAVGLTWSHVLGDPISAFAFVNAWAHFLDGRTPPKYLSSGEQPLVRLSPQGEIVKLGKMVTVTDNCWVRAGNGSMGSRSFQLTSKHLKNMFADVVGGSSYFQVISAFLWKLIAKIRDDSSQTSVLICTVSGRNRIGEGAGNMMKLSTLEADPTILNLDVQALAAQIAEKQAEETTFMDEDLCSENGNLHRVMYGASLTFVDLEEANFYEMELRGNKPLLVNYMIDGVDKEGSVVLLRGPGDGRTITLTFPEERLVKIAIELERACNLS